MITLQAALDSLNKEQREAALHIDGPLLVLAGAGSGKTKTLTTRLAYLIDEIGISPQATLTLTFTNKAASEMRQRALGLISNNSYSKPLLSTFHKFGRIFLERYIHVLNRKNNFLLLDNDDKNGILKRLNSNKKVKFTDINNYISNCKNQMLDAQAASEFARSVDEKYKNIIYTQYEELLLAQNALDFDDLLYLPYRIMKENQDIQTEVSQQYQYIMVDEYQDTNHLQYELLKQLTSTHQNIVVVGDDDQSIYGWRGAEIRNILDFHKQFDNVKTIKLEQNYRSTTQILEVANRLISHNQRRLGKNLVSQKGDGEDVRVDCYYDETQESEQITKKIQNLINSGESPKEIAILFRLNALSLGIERALNRAKVAYKLVGGMRFYERTEIKDLLCYLRMVYNINDDISLYRIINKPHRSIGDVTKDKIYQASQARHISIYDAFRQGYLDFLSPKAYSGMVNLFELINKLKEAKDLRELSQMIEKNIDIPGIYFKNDSIEYEEKLANIEECLGQMRDFAKRKNDMGEDAGEMIWALGDFLNDLSLASSADPVIAEDMYLIDGRMTSEEINCMNIHNSKGLEFKHVFVMGLEEGIFPVQNDNEEEERRLGYVAFTRAKEHLHLSYVRSRYYRGKREDAVPSRFLKEIKTQGEVYSNQDEINTGDLVFHKVFGTGIVIGLQEGSMKIYKVNFGGIKRNMIEAVLSKVPNT